MNCYMFGFLVLAATIPFYLLWLGDLFTELATLIFYVVSGYQFRPAVDNPYLLSKGTDSNVSLLPGAFDGEFNFICR
jgi:hypothetical protein